jgi:hypothetical protein
MTDEPKNPLPPEPMPWDRIGSVLGDVAAAGKSIADRNLTAWGTVSQHLRKKEYTINDWSTDAALGVQTVLANMLDAWEFVRRVPERERVADTLPTAFMLVAKDGANRVAADPVWMRVPPAASATLPDHPTIDLTGGSGPADVELLKKNLHTTRADSKTAYLLEITNPENLNPGVYSGTVYLDTPTVFPIANLRVIVQ